MWRLSQTFANLSTQHSLGINKESSAELQEAINSMFRWYGNAEICYAYLEEIIGSCPTIDDPRLCGVPPKVYETYISTDQEVSFWLSTFVDCKWFKRGWTLQELIAPKKLSFFGQKWNYIGSKPGLSDLISRVTNIDKSVLDHNSEIHSVSVARRMSWAANRKTSRVEDQAYSLLGIFGVNLPMLYGEGMRAFQRLQEEVMKVSNDHSILAWTVRTSKGSLLADSPADFLGAHNVEQWARPDSFEMTNRGLRITLRVIAPRESHDRPEYLAILNCRYRDDIDNLLAIRLRKYPESDNFYVINTSYSDAALHEEGFNHSRLETVPMDDAASVRPDPLVITRNFEPHAYQVTFIFRLVEGEGFQHKPLICHFYPPTSWTFPDPKVGVMRANQYPSVRAGARFKCSAGGYFYIVFGLDIIEGWEMVNFIRFPGVHVVHSRKPLGSGIAGGLEFFCSSWKPCQHDVGCLHTTGGCQHMPQSASVKGDTESEILKADIRLQGVLGETVCTVSVRIT